VSEPPNEIVQILGHGHTLAVDSRPSIYVAATNFGRRVQKFKVVDGR